MKYLALFCIGLITFVAAACTVSSSNAGANSPTVANTGSANVTTVVPYPAANGVPMDANSARSSNTGQAPVKVVPPPGDLKPMTFPAPDDSEYSSTMDKSGLPVETRLFHSDPLLLKVERIWKSPSDKIVNIYLKNGKVVKVPGDQWPDIKSQPVNSFYDAAGLKLPQRVNKADPNVKKEAKPKQ